ncbi:peroxisomal biogenesis factor 13 isoform X3 [Haemaphysalis longicornis]
MTSPLKPWEGCTAGRPTASTNGPVHNSSWEESFGGGAVPSGPMGQPSLGTPSVPPPLPPRPTQQPLLASSTYGSGYSSGYGSGYGYTSPYGSGLSPLYSRYGYGASGYGYGSGYGGMYGTGGLYGTGGMYGAGGMYGGAGPLTQLAEESTRGAFHSVEAVVQAFASVSLLLESTYGALQSSFRAVVGVADQFGRLRLHLAQTLSALALLRSLRWLLARAWYLLTGRRGGVAAAEAAWGQAASGGAGLPPTPPGDGSSSWPIVAFFGFVVGAPWLLWRIFAAAAANKETRWASGADEHYVAVAQFDFQADGPNELSLVTGQELRLAPRELQPRVRGWLLASVDGTRVGLVPANYVKVLGARPPSAPSKEEKAGTAEAATAAAP